MKNKMLSLLLIAILVLTLCSCGESEKTNVTENAKYKVYRVNNNVTKVIGVGTELVTDDVYGQIDEFLALLKSEPSDVTYKKAIPDTVTIRDYSLENGELTVNFESNYFLLSGIDEILRRTAIVKTLCQVDGVDFVAFTVGGQPLMDSNGLPVGFMESSDFIDNTGGETNYLQTVIVTLYYADETGENLKSTRHQIEFDGTISLENLVLKQLIAGPLAEEEGLVCAIPSGTVVNKVSKKDGICYVDFNSMFLENNPDVNENIVVYSVVNSLAEISGISKVQFTINGEIQKKYRESLDFDGLFERNLELIAQ